MVYVKKISLNIYYSIHLLLKNNLRLYIVNIFYDLFLTFIL